MKKTSIFLLGLFLVFNLVGIQNNLIAQDKNPCEEFGYTKGKKLDKIEDILTSNSKSYKEEKVTVVGIVSNFRHEQSESKSYYELKGKFGKEIRVSSNANDEPKQLTFYIVEGTVYIPETTVIRDGVRYTEYGEPFIHEESKIECAQVVVTDTTNQGGNNGSGGSGGEDTWLEDNMVYVLAGVGVFLLIIIIIIIALGQNKKKEKAETERQRQYEANMAQKASTQKVTKQAKPKVDDDQDFKTIKIFLDDPKTMKFIPGKLEIVSGDDKGKNFLISGYPTTEGSVVTIGRENVTGDRKYAHIQLDKRFQTVGRKQAELIYKGGKLYARNMGDTNPTQVDGKELQVGQMAEVMPGSIIRTGELEFKYIV